MAEQWIVRVQGKEYGPVDLDELRAWRQDGRLIRDNEIREAESDHWFRAGELPEVFADDLNAAAVAPAAGVSRMSFAGIFAASWRIYRRGFGRFFLLSLLVAVPWFFLQMAAPYLHMPENKSETTVVISGVAVAFVVLTLLIIAWPFSIGGLQILAADLFAGQNPGLREVLHRAKALWMRIFILSLTVYGSYFFWSLLPLLIARSLLPAMVTSPWAFLLILALLIFVAYMVVRLFINFLFWQQAGALGGLEAMEALQESKDLARSGAERPRLERPLYRGAIIASLWLVIIIGVNLVLNLPAIIWQVRETFPAMLTQFREGIPPEQLLSRIEAMQVSSLPFWLTSLTTLLTSLAHAVLRPWLAAIFVVLYLDTKGRAR